LQGVNVNHNSKADAPQHPAGWARTFFPIWTGQAASLLGSSLAGFALVWWLASTSTSATVLAGATLMMVLPLCFIPIPNPSPGPKEGVQKPSVWGDMREGLRFVWGWPGLTIVLAMAAPLNFFGVPCLSFIPLLVTNHFQMGALELGWLETVAGVGLLGGGLLLSTWGGFRSRVVTMFAALALQGFGAILLGIAPVNAFFVALAGNLLWGFARPIIDGLIFAILQATVPPEMLGRVFSLILSAAALMTPLGLLVGGPAVDVLGVRFWFVLAGVLTLCASVLGFLIPAVRRLEQKKITLPAADGRVQRT
jgi:DHA3 family macrolide efflux protein-like MFS transporter